MKNTRIGAKKRLTAIRGGITCRPISANAQKIVLNACAPAGTTASSRKMISHPSSKYHLTNKKPLLLDKIKTKSTI
ncbi:MAG: hypothetical protein ACOX5A_02260 [Aminivibrio sp.]